MYRFFGILARRKRRDIEQTQEQLARATGIAQNTISAIESGQQEPRLDNALRIAYQLEISLDQLAEQLAQDEGRAR
jgi:transcriptional regulator with XRE-family HTH domain